MGILIYNTRAEVSISSSNFPVFDASIYKKWGELLKSRWTDVFHACEVIKNKLIAMYLGFTESTDLSSWVDGCSTSLAIKCLLAMTNTLLFPNEIPIIS